MTTNNKQESIWVNGQEMQGTVHAWQEGVFGNVYLVEVEGSFHRASRDEDDGMLVSRNNALSSNLVEAAYELSFIDFAKQAA